MAKELTSLKFLTRTTKYDWPNWSNGKVWELKHQEDFSVSPQQFRSNAYNYASRMNLKVVTSVKGDCVYLQFTS